MKKIVVTTSWDDGHILDMKMAVLLKKYNMPATFYVSPKNRELPLEKRLSKEEVQTLAHDFEIGAHTMTHPRLSTVNDDVANEEIVASKKFLEGITQKPVVSFCYPGGDYEAKHETMVRNAGFTLARTVTRFATEIGGDPFAIPTTIHAYRHFSDAGPIFKEAGILNFARHYSRWDDLAIAIFDNVTKNGGVFHLWGHSWEIDKNDDWGRLARVFAHIAGSAQNHDAKIEKLTNGELLSAMK